MCRCDRCSNRSAPDSWLEVWISRRRHKRHMVLYQAWSASRQSWSHSSSFSASSRSYLRLSCRWYSSCAGPKPVNPPLQCIKKGDRSRVTCPLFSHLIDSRTTLCLDSLNGATDTRISGYRLHQPPDEHRIDLCRIQSVFGFVHKGYCNGYGA